MQIVRSTIAASEIRHTIGDNYSDCPHDATCLFESRGVNDNYPYTNGKLSCFFKIYARKDIDRGAIEAEIELVNHLRQSGQRSFWEPAPISPFGDQGQVDL